MARFYVEHNGEWNIFSTIVDDFLFDEFVCIDALKARLLYERFKELTEDIDSLMTDKPKVNVMPYEEAVRIADRKTENSSEIPNNCEWCKFYDGEDCYSQEPCKAKDELQTEKGGCTNCDGKDLCNNAFTEISQYCGAYEPQNGYQTFNGTSVYVSRLEDEPQTGRSE